MKFTLIYDGELPAGPDKRSEYAARIRNELHSQMRDLWDNHLIMKQLRHEARVYERPTTNLGGGQLPTALPNKMDEPRPLQAGMIDLVAPIPVDGVGSFLPIVRESLHLACAIDLKFLRHEEPMHLMTQGGDIDNRLKCFFDGLTMPKREQAGAGEPPCADPLCVLLENDQWISDFSVTSGRLLGRAVKGRFDVHIQAEITVKVLRVFEGNLCLVGG